jgi:hypothetical protein
LAPPVVEKLHTGAPRFPSKAGVLMSKNLSYHVLLKDIEEQISDGWDSVNKLENAMHERNADNDYESESYDAEEIFFKSKLERI